jgi:ribosomal protein S18 acetylase RimI-like enzyme
MTAIQIRHGFEETQRAQTAEIYYSAFNRKLTAVFGASETGISLVQIGLNPACCFTAVDAENHIIGVAGFHHRGQHFFNVRWRTLTDQFGLISGTKRYFQGALLTRNAAKDLLQMDGIAVHESARGMGVGSRLIEALTNFAAVQGYKGVRLDVVDTNPDAQRLYIRQGFQSLHTKHYPFLKNMGFTAVTTMVKSIP